MAADELNHYDGVCAWRHGGTGHDLNASAGSKRRADGIACLDFADAAERGASGSFAGTNGVAVACRTIKGRVVTIGLDFLSEDETESFGEWQRQCGKRPPLAVGDFADDELSSLFEGEQQGPRFLEWSYCSGFATPHIEALPSS
jgi:hypothetical protein